MKILITGGMGFIGSNLIDLLLQEKHKIIVLTKSYSKKKNISHIRDKIKVEKVDITNHRKLSNIIEQYKPEMIIHLAGETSHSKSFENPLKDIDSNAKTKFVETPRYTKKVDVGNFVVDNSKLRSLGWKPKISIEEGIEKTLKYFKDEKI